MKQPKNLMPDPGVVNGSNYSSYGTRIGASNYKFKTEEDKLNFYQTYYEDAKKATSGSIISPEVMLAQAYQETVGGRNMPKNNMFGMPAAKPGKGVGIYETLEYFDTDNYYKTKKVGDDTYIDDEYSDRKLYSVKEVTDPNSTNYGKYKYQVDRYFREYNSISEGMLDYLDNFSVTSDYDDAMKQLAKDNDQKEFINNISGFYATAGGYNKGASEYYDDFKKINDHFTYQWGTHKENKSKLNPGNYSTTAFKKGGIPKGNVEAEGKELVLRNTHGDMAIIPKKYRQEALDMIKEGCDGCLDNLISTLPKVKDYAKDGTIIDGGPFSKVGAAVRPANTFNAATSTKNNVPYQWSDAPINTTPLAVPSAYTTTQGKSDSGSAHINPIQEQLRIANLWRTNNLDPKYDQELRSKYGVTPQQILYTYDPTYAQEMANVRAKYNIGDASLNPHKLQYPSTDLRRGDNVAPNTEWMYPNLTGQTRAGITTQANQDLAFDIIGSGMASKYFKPTVVNQRVKEVVENSVVNKVDDVAKPIVSSVDDVGKSFKSEIDWAKWNKEIPENKALIQEYNAIEQAFKETDTWMKNPDGSAFKGTPEQFVQQNSENFKKAFPEGYNEVWRGANNDAMEDRIGKSIFTANKDLAIKYTGMDIKKFHNPNVEKASLPGRNLFQLASKKSSNSIELDNFGREWTAIDLTNPKQSIDNINLNIKNLEKQVEKHRNLLKTGKQNPDGSWSFPDSDIQYSDYLYKKGTVEKEKILKSYKDRLENINNLVKNPKELEKMKLVLGNLTTTDDIAKYIEDVNLDYVKIKNVVDGDFGDVSIINHKEGNYLKSLVGNNGMFRMTNPNIYKSLIPLLGYKLIKKAENS